MTMNFRSDKRSNQNGFTLIELLTVISIIGLLIAILLPAISSARSAARRTACSSNLKQLGQALSIYESVHGVYPSGMNGFGYSLHVMLLPHIEQAHLFNSINFSIPANLISGDSGNRTSYINRIDTFICADQAIKFGHSGTSYTGNRGVGERISQESGVFTSNSIGYTPGEIMDGMSQTVAISEWVVGPVDLQFKDVKGSVFETPSRLIGTGNIAPFIRECQSLDIDRVAINNNDKGLNWILGGYRHTLYNHTMPVNNYSCVSAGMAKEGAYTATSHHSGGVNTLFVDGHTGFIKNNISLPVWRALGTRSGGDFDTP